MIALLAGCAHRVALPALGDPAALAPRWPAAPDVARVGYVGAIELPGLERPLDVACHDGQLAVADPQGGDVWVVALDDGRAERVSRRGGAPREPVGVSFGPSGDLWVADIGAVRLVALHPGKARWEALPAAFTRPTASAWVGDRLAVVDTAAHRVWSTDPRTGEARPWGPERGEAGVGFNFPVDAAADGAGGLWVADAMNAVVEHLDPDGVPAVVAGGLVRPKGVAVDRWGRLHVVDAAMQHVQVYEPDGTLLGRYGGPGDGPGELSLPSGICIERDLVYVADSLNRRVQVYALLEEGP